jgi:cysteine desulfurase
MAAEKNTNPRVYFDHNATTYMRSEVVDCMMPFFRNRFGNASSLHFFGQENRDVIDTAREQAALLIGAEPEEIIFTSGGTESDNLAIRGVVRAKRGKVQSPHVITSVVEHPAVLKTCESLEKEGVSVTYIPVTSEGVVRVDLVEKSLKPETVLVSIMLSNNETGVIQPIGEISAITRDRRVVLHTDAVQAVGKIDVNVEKLGVDLLSISGHKFYGPKGIGALYVRRGTALEPVYTGGGHESGLRPGTENIPGIVGFAEACRISNKELPGEVERISRLRDRLEAGILERVDHCTVNGRRAPRVPNTSNITFSYVEGEAVTLNLSMVGFAVSSGSACASGASEPSSVLLAMGLEPADAQGAIRISLGIINTDEDVDAFIEVLPGIIERLRELSPLQDRN